MNKLLFRLLGIISISILSACAALPTARNAQLTSESLGPIATYDVAYANTFPPGEVWGAIILGSQAQSDAQTLKAVCDGILSRFVSRASAPTNRLKRIVYFFDTRNPGDPSATSDCNPTTGLTSHYSQTGGDLARAFLTRALTSAKSSQKLPDSSSYTALLALYDPTHGVAGWLTISKNESPSNVAALVTAFATNVVDSDLTAIAGSNLKVGQSTTATVGNDGPSNTAGAPKSFWQDLWDNVLKPALAELLKEAVPIIITLVKTAVGIA